LQLGTHLIAFSAFVLAEKIGVTSMHIVHGVHVSKSVYYMYSKDNLCVEQYRRTDKSNRQASSNGIQQRPVRRRLRRHTKRTY
jgi:hypothetical protein